MPKLASLSSTEVMVNMIRASITSNRLFMQSVSRNKLPQAIYLEGYLDQIRKSARIDCSQPFDFKNAANDFSKNEHREDGG